VLAHSYEPVGAPVPLVLTAGVPPACDDDLVLALIPGHRAARLHAGPLLREE
jgi:hypothetical protein